MLLSLASDGDARGSGNWNLERARLPHHKNGATQVERYLFRHLWLSAPTCS